MLKYCLRCKGNTQNINSKMLKTKDCREILSSKYAKYGSKRSRCLKEREAKGF